MRFPPLVVADCRSVGRGTRDYGLVFFGSALTRRELWQPFAWPAREFLRSKVVGKPCTFELEETVESIGRTFGNVFINGENLAASVVAAGWAKVRRSRFLPCVRTPVRSKARVPLAATGPVWSVEGALTRRVSGQVKEVKGNNAARNAYLEELVQYERQAQEAGACSRFSFVHSRTGLAPHVSRRRARCCLPWLERHPQPKVLLPCVGSRPAVARPLNQHALPNVLLHHIKRRDRTLVMQACRQRWMVRPRGRTARVVTVARRAGRCRDVEQEPERRRAVRAQRGQPRAGGLRREGDP